MRWGASIWFRPCSSWARYSRGSGASRPPGRSCSRPGAAVKAFPLALAPVLLRGEKRLARVALAAAIPLAIAAAIVLVPGDEFGSALSYHTERGLQVESLAATPLEIDAIDDVGRGAEFGSGSWNFTGPGASAARAISIGIGVALYAALLLAGWRDRGISHLRLGTATLAAVVICSPVLSPQFLFWLLPLSAAAYGISWANAVLIAGFVATQLMLQYYARIVVDFDSEFVWRLAGRNAILLVYLALVCVPVLRSLTPWPRASST